MKQIKPNNNKKQGKYMENMRNIKSILEAS